jgi:hypothetical protein
MRYYWFGASKYAARKSYATDINASSKGTIRQPYRNHATPGGTQSPLRPAVPLFNTSRTAASNLPKSPLRERVTKITGYLALFRSPASSPTPHLARYLIAAAVRRGYRNKPVSSVSRVRHDDQACRRIRPRFQAGAEIPAPRFNILPVRVSVASVKDPKRTPCPCHPVESSLPCYAHRPSLLSPRSSLFRTSAFPVPE